jgi:hypothetical protein
MTLDERDMIWNAYNAWNTELLTTQLKDKISQLYNNKDQWKQEYKYLLEKFDLNREQKQNLNILIQRQPWYDDYKEAKKYEKSKFKTNRKKLKADFDKLHKNKYIPFKNQFIQTEVKNIVVNEAFKTRWEKMYTKCVKKLCLLYLQTLQALDNSHKSHNSKYPTLNKKSTNNWKRFEKRLREFKVRKQNTSVTTMNDDTMATWLSAIIVPKKLNIETVSKFLNEIRSITHKYRKNSHKIIPVLEKSLFDKNIGAFGPPEIHFQHKVITGPLPNAPEPTTRKIIKFVKYNFDTDYKKQTQKIRERCALNRNGLWTIKTYIQLLTREKNENELMTLQQQDKKDSVHTQCIHPKCTLSIAASSKFPLCSRHQKWFVLGNSKNTKVDIKEVQSNYYHKLHNWSIQSKTSSVIQLDILSVTYKDNWFGIQLSNKTLSFIFNFPDTNHLRLLFSISATEQYIKLQKYDTVKGWNSIYTDRKNFTKTKLNNVLNSIKKQVNIEKLNYNIAYKISAFDQSIVNPLIMKIWENKTEAYTNRAHMRILPVEEWWYETPENKAHLLSIIEVKEILKVLDITQNSADITGATSKYQKLNEIWNSFFNNINNCSESHIKNMIIGATA